MEIYTREAQDSLNQMVLSTYAEKYDVINYFLKVSDSIQNKFDLDTDHGTIEEENKKWTYLIESELKKPQ